MSLQLRPAAPGAEARLRRVRGLAALSMIVPSERCEGGLRGARRASTGPASCKKPCGERSSRTRKSATRRPGAHMSKLPSILASRLWGRCRRDGGLSMAGSVRRHWEHGADRVSQEVGGHSSVYDRVQRTAEQVSYNHGDAVHPDCLRTAPRLCSPDHPQGPPVARW